MGRISFPGENRAPAIASALALLFVLAALIPAVAVGSGEGMDSPGASIVLNEPRPSAVTRYTDATINITTLRVPSGSVYEFINCKINFQNSGSQLVIEPGGRVNISGPLNPSKPSASTITSKGGVGYSIKALRGSSFLMNRTKVEAPSTSLTYKAVMELYEGDLSSSRFTGLKNLLRVQNSGVVMKNLTIEGAGTNAGLVFDTNHTWSKEPTTVDDVEFKGTFGTPLSILNNSVWMPNDAQTMYYAESGSVSLILSINLSGYSDPYLRLPHFIDSRSTNAKLDLEYSTSGTWSSFPSFPKSNQIMKEWVTGDGAKVPLDLAVSGQGLADLRLTWSAPSEGLGCVYILTPSIGSSNRVEKAITESPWLYQLGDWGKKPVTAKDNSLKLTEIVLGNASSMFMDVQSSGMASIVNFTAGGPGIEHGADPLLFLNNSGVLVGRSRLYGGGRTDTGIYIASDLGDDWNRNTVENVNMTCLDHTMDYGIHIKNGWTSITNTVINKTHTGIKGEKGMLFVDTLSLEVDMDGVDVLMPSDYVSSMASLTLKSTKVRGNYKGSGIIIDGDDLAYRPTIRIDSCDLFSNATGSSTSGGYIGGVVVNVTTNNDASIMVKGDIFGGLGNGITIVEWPFSEPFMVNNTNIRDMEMDGIHSEVPLTLRVHSTNIKECDHWGIDLREGTNLSLQPPMLGGRYLIESNMKGGINLEKGSIFNIKNYDIKSNIGTAIAVGEGSTGTLIDTKLQYNYLGMTISQGSDVTMERVEASYSSQGHGISASRSNLTIKGGISDYNRFSNNQGSGIELVQGWLDISNTTLAGNKLTGLAIEDSWLKNLWNVNASRNGNDGVSVRIGSDEVLEPYGSRMGKAVYLTAIGNGGIGLSLEHKSSGMVVPIEGELEGFRLNSNTGGDVMGGPLFHLYWKMMNFDSVGASTFYGRITANIDFEVKTGRSVMFRNENITLVGPSRSIVLGKDAVMNLKNCNIKPYNPLDRFGIEVGMNATFSMEGGYLKHLSALRAVKSKNIKLDGTLIESGDSGIYLNKTTFDILNCNIGDIAGRAVQVEDSAGLISGTTFVNNMVGLDINGLSQDATVQDSEFVGNKWGIYAFSTSGNELYVTETSFSDNDPTPLWVGKGTVVITDSQIDPYEIMARDALSLVQVRYTLTVQLIDEMGSLRPFDITLKRGTPPSSTVNNGVTQFLRVLESYTVKDRDSVDASKADIEVSIRYVDYMEGSNVHYGYETAEFVLDQRTDLVFSGYLLPIKTGKFQNQLLAFEDGGFYKGGIDIKDWFADVGTDQGNLTYQAQQTIPEMVPFLTGTVLTISLKENWNGTGSINLIVTDPHGKQLVAPVTIMVQSVNDPPTIANPRILSSDGSSKVITGDRIMAVWEWYDIDSGDEEPSNHLIRWYLNGVHVEDIDNYDSVPSPVISGQIWNYTIIPADWHGLNYGDLGLPVSSPPITVGNAPPTLTSISFVSKNPNTNTDLQVFPGSWSDPDSTVVTFNYLWERKVGSSYVAIGAPNSPVLDRSFTTKGDEIRVRAWASDGIDISDIVSDTVRIRNSAPVILNAVLMPEQVTELTERIYVTDIEWADVDGDTVYLTFTWTISGIPIPVPDSSVPELLRTYGGWSWPQMVNISLGIIPEDSENELGATYYLSTHLKPVDTDNDGIPDLDDVDDDNDGFEDIEENYLKTDPKDPASRPLDTDGDGHPDGDAFNTMAWMDLDDDNDGIDDGGDSFPTNPLRPGDLDNDGIGDDQDQDIDGDGVPNAEDDYPFDRFHSKAPKEPFDLMQLFILLLIILIIAGVLTLGYLVYSGRVELPTKAPPSVAGEAAEAVFEEDGKPGKRSAEEEIIDMEDLDKMSVCSQCGELISSDDEVCPSCGAVFEEDEAEMEEFEEEE